MSETLKQFYKEMQAWIEAGFPKHSAFEKSTGLCGNLYRMVLRQYRMGLSECLPIPAIGVLDELAEQFVNKGYDQVHPFGGAELYIVEYRSADLYKNPARLAWVKEHANE